MEKSEAQRKSSLKNKSIYLNNNSSVVSGNFSNNINKTITLKNKENLNQNFQSNPQVKEEKIPESEFSKEEIEDPDCISNMNSMKLMEIKIKQIDEKIKKIEGRPPAALRQKFLQLKCRYNTLKEQIMEGDLTLENYIVLLKKQIDKDQRLILFFKQNASNEKAILVTERLKIQMDELNDGIKQAKKNI